MIWVGILGAKGYFKEILSKLVAGHPEAQISTIMDLQELCDGGACMYCNNESGAEYRSIVNAIEKSDIIFNGLPGIIMKDVYSKALTYGKRIIDISDDHNMRTGLKERTGNTYPGSIYGLCKLYKDKINNASIAVNPSSYCTGAILGLVPLVAGNPVNIDSVIVESKSGIIGLRRDDKLIETDMIINCDKKIYKIESSNYAEEVNLQMTTLFDKKVPVSYTSYIVPGMKGITTTIKINTHEGMCGSDISKFYKDFYKFNSNIEVFNSEMTDKMKKGLNKCFCKIGVSTDKDFGKITVTTVLDDVVRGAVSQAVQTMNLMCGIDGETGL